MSVAESVTVLQRLQADISLAQKLARKKGELFDPKAEITETIYPLLIKLVQEVQEIDDGIADIVDPEESYVQPELAQVLMAAFALGGDLCVFIEEQIDSLQDDLKKKKLRDKVREFQEAAEIAILCVQEALSSGSDDDDGDADKKTDSETKTDDEGKNE